MWTQVWRPHVHSKNSAFVKEGLCLRQVQNNPKMTSNKAPNYLCMAEHKGIHLALLWQSRSFGWDLWPSQERNEFQAAYCCQNRFSSVLEGHDLFLARHASWLHSWEKQTHHRSERAIVHSTWYSCFLPTYSERKTTKNGVTRSLIPWTYPLAGCRMAQINRILSKI